MVNNNYKIFTEMHEGCQFSQLPKLSRCVACLELVFDSDGIPSDCWHSQGRCPHGRREQGHSYVGFYYKCNTCPSLLMSVNVKTPCYFIW